MTRDTQVAPIAMKQIVYAIPGMDAVSVRRGIVYRSDDSGPLELDAYYPPDAPDNGHLPATVLVTGFPDAGAKRMLGCHFKDMGAFVSWARLIAASGSVAISYVNKQPETDVRALLAYVRENAEFLNIDAERTAIWACSGHGPTALSVMMSATPGDGLRGAVLSNPYTLDVGGATHVTQASRQIGFVEACAGASVADLPSHLPMFVVRAGRDAMPGLNAALDRFVAQALEANLPLTLVNHATAPHAFDLFDDSDATRDVIKQMVEFIPAQVRR